MKTILDQLTLPQVQEIITCDRRALPEHKPPGMGGSLFQNLGRSPTSILLWGVATGSGAFAFTEKLEKIFRAGKPVRFVADIVTDSRISKVVIENLEIQDLAGKPARFAYVLSLRESVSPARSQSTQSVDAGIAADGANLAKGLVPAKA